MMIDQCTFACKCIGELHSRLLHEKSRTIGRALNAFDTTINIKTDKGELLVISLGKLRSPVNLNVIPSNGTIGFKQIVPEDAEARVQVEMVGGQPTAALLIGDAIIMLGEHEKFQNHFSHLKPKAVQTFASNSDRIFSALVSQAQFNRFGCLLKPDITTRELIDRFTDQLIQDIEVLDYREFNARISRGLLELCGKGPGFTPAGDDFIAGYLAMTNWLNDAMKVGDAILPGHHFSVLTTWTSFKLIEYGARNILDDQAQDMINCVAENNVDAYIEAVELISKRGHTSGIDFATGMTIALFTVADRVFKTRVVENIMQTIRS